KEDEVLAIALPEAPGQFNYSNRSFPVTVQSENEFPLEVRTKYAEVIQEEGNMVLVKTKIKCTTPPDYQLECCINTFDEKTDETYSYSAKAASDFYLHADSTVTIYSEQFAGSNFKKIKDVSGIKTYFWNRGKSRFNVLNYEV